MCKIFDEIREEGIAKGKADTAIEMIKDGKLSIELISKYSGLSIEKINDLVRTITA